MNRLSIRTHHVIAALLLAPISAWAADHQICYQEPAAPGTNKLIGRFDCRTDGASAPGCTLQSIAPTAATLPPPAMLNPWGADVAFAQAGTYVATFRFADGVLRNCTVQIAPSAIMKPSLGNQYPQAIGFTTDVSGAVTTGVWAATSASSDPAFQEVVVPPDFVAVGGGASGAEAPGGFLLTSSIHDNGNLGPAGPQLWTAGAHANVAPQPSPTITTFAIGLHIEGVPTASLRQMVTFPLTQTPPPGTNAPTLTLMTSAFAPAGNIAIAGGVQAQQVSSATAGQYVTNSQPLTAQQCYITNACETVVTGWTVASKDHMNPSPWWIIGQLTTLPKVLTIGGNVFHIETWVAGANSTVVAHPSTAVSLPADFALTGVGATVNWQTSPRAQGNLLWDLKPRPDINGAEVASKDSMVSSPASITAYAIGMKLVAGPVPLPAATIIRRPVQPKLPLRQ